MADKDSHLLCLLLWFEVDEDSAIINLDKLGIFKRVRMDIEDKPVSVVNEICLGKYCAEAYETVVSLILLRDSRYVDDIGDSVKSENEDGSDGS